MTIISQINFSFTKLAPEPLNAAGKCSQSSFTSRRLNDFLQPQGGDVTPLLPFHWCLSSGGTWYFLAPTQLRFQTIRVEPKM